MEEELQDISEPQEENEKKSKAVYILGGVIIFILALALLGYLFRGNDTVQGITTPVIKIINPDYAAPTATPTPSAPTSTKTTLSGTVSLKDPAPSESTVAIGIREANKANFEPVIVGLKTEDGVSWKWEGAMSGISYEVQAFLVSNIKTLISQSAIQEATAPKQGIDLTIDFAELPSPPKGSLTIDCKDRNSDGKWRVSYTYNINNPTTPAQQYRLLAGTDKSGTLVMDMTTTPKSPDTTQSYMTGHFFENDRVYYGAYAYATCESCNEFSKISEPVEFKCKETATPTPTVTPTPTATPTATPTPEAELY